MMKLKRISAILMIALILTGCTYNAKMKVLNAQLAETEQHQKYLYKKEAMLDKKEAILDRRDKQSWLYDSTVNAILWGWRAAITYSFYKFVKIYCC